MTGNIEYTITYHVLAPTQAFNRLAFTLDKPGKF